MTDIKCEGCDKPDEGEHVLTDDPVWLCPECYADLVREIREETP